METWRTACMEKYRSGHNELDSKSGLRFGTSPWETLISSGFPGYFDNRIVQVLSISSLLSLGADVKINRVEKYRSGHNELDSKSGLRFGTSPWETLISSGFPGYFDNRIVQVLSISSLLSLGADVKINRVEKYRSGHNELDSKSSCPGRDARVRIPPSPPNPAAGLSFRPAAFFYLRAFYAIFHQIFPFVLSKTASSSLLPDPIRQDSSWVRTLNASGPTRLTTAALSPLPVRT